MKIQGFLFFLLFAAQTVYALDDSYLVSRVMDGDTFKLSNGQTLKLAGVNAPELHDATKLPGEARRFHKEIWAYRNLGVDAQTVSEKMIKAAANEIRI